MNKKRILSCLLAGIMICSLTACGGGYYKNANNSNNDFSFEASLSTKDEETSNAESDVEGAVDASHVNTGSVYMMPDGTVTGWNQYGYDESGNLVSERRYYAGYDSYTETTYNEAGLVTGVVNYGADGNGFGTLYSYDEQGNVLSVKNSNEEWTDMNIDYTYDKDENGRVIRQYAKFVNDAEPYQYADYSYDEAGNLEKKSVYYVNADGQLGEEYVYDDNGNVVSEQTFSGGVVDGYHYYEYDANGDLVHERYANLIETQEVVYNYVYSYDDNGNLIFVNTCDKNGTILNKQLSAYAEAAENYSVEELTAQAQETERKFYATTPKEDAHFELVKEKILNEETLFTFGYYSSQFMQPESIDLVEFGWDEQGRYCKVDVTYSSDYGKYHLGGEVYYIIDGIGDLQLTACKLSSWGDADVYRKIIENQTPREYLYVHYNSYFPTKTTTESIEQDKSSYYEFAGLAEEFVGIVKVKSSQSPDVALRMGEFTAEPCMEENVEEGVNFILKMCWENGLVEKHYCASIYDQYTFLILGYDEETWEPISKKLYLIEGAPSYVREILLKRAAWEWEDWE